MRRQRFIGAGLLAAALVAGGGGTARADDAVSVSVAGPSSGVSAFCPPGTHPGTWTVTDVDGSRIDRDQRVEWTAIGEGGRVAGIGAWIAPYLDSPPPPAAITLTVVCRAGDAPTHHG
jgi:hypothetical protein